MNPYRKVFSSLDEGEVFQLFTEGVLNNLLTGNSGPFFFYEPEQPSTIDEIRRLFNDEGSSSLFSFFKDVIFGKFFQKFNVSGSTLLAIPPTPVIDTSLVGLPTLPFPPTGGELPWALSLSTLLVIPQLPDPMATLNLLVTSLVTRGILTPGPPRTVVDANVVNIRGEPSFEFLGDPERPSGDLIEGVFSDIQTTLINVATSSMSRYINSTSMATPLILANRQIIQIEIISMCIASPTISKVFSQKTYPKNLAACIASIANVWSRLITLIYVGVAIGTGNYLDSIRRQLF